MAAFLKKDLKYQYSWVTIGDDDPRKTGKPDSVLLNRHEGYEVLPFLNNYCANTSWTGGETTLASFQLLEKLLREAVPGNLRSRENITTWLRANWASYVPKAS